LSERALRFAIARAILMQTVGRIGALAGTAAAGKGKQIWINTQQANPIRCGDNTLARGPTLRS
jgi:hypothetical protein